MFGIFGCLAEVVLGTGCWFLGISCCGHPGGLAGVYAGVAGCLGCCVQQVS